MTNQTNPTPEEQRERDAVLRLMQVQLAKEAYGFKSMTVIELMKAIERGDHRKEH